MDVFCFVRLLQEILNAKHLEGKKSAQSSASEGKPVEAERLHAVWWVVEDDQDFDACLVTEDIPLS